jgi:transcriptional regulator GlxA family with amidase domain
VLFHVAQELFTGSDTFALTRGLNLWLAMIQKDYGGYVAASIGEQLLFSNLGQAQRASMRFSHEAVNHIV